MPRVAPLIELSPEKTQELERRFRAGGSPVAVVSRYRIGLLTAKGLPSQEIVQNLEIPEQKVGK
jgi:hypothetical protein